MEEREEEESPCKKPCIDGIGTISELMPAKLHARHLYFKFSLSGKTSKEPECQPSFAIKKILDEESKKKNPNVPTYICAALDFFHFTFHLYLECAKALNIQSRKRFDYLGLGEHVHIESDPDYLIKGGLLQMIKGTHYLLSFMCFNLTRS